MDFIEQLQVLSSKIAKLCDHLQTEEATKNALVLPFISILGYDIFDPTEVVPEFTADVGIKKGEKVDYAVKKNGQVILLFECKKCNTDLEHEHASQLYRYFSVTEARVAVLTDGVSYRFFTDLDAQNKMDSKPFMEFNMLDIQEPLVAELKKLSKNTFDVDQVIGSAGEQKYMRELKRIMAEQLNSPCDEFVRFFARQLHSGSLTQSVMVRFSDITKRGLHQFINERINERLKSAMTNNSAGETLQNTVELPKDSTTESAANSKDGSAVTTDEEKEAYLIVKAILREMVDPNRVVGRDTQSHYGVLLDDTNRKPICRLHFNRPQKYLGLIGEGKVEERVPLNLLG